MWWGGEDGQQCKIAVNSKNITQLLKNKRL